jgi:hypothetical protein
MRCAGKYDPVDRTLRAIGITLLAAIGFGTVGALISAQAAPQKNWGLRIVLPPKIVTGERATLAVFGADGKLTSDVNVMFGNGESVTTDDTGRASFTAPAAGTVLLAKAAGAAAAAILEPAAAGNRQLGALVASFVSLHEPVPICGGGFQGDADGNHVRINGEPALVMAASPECVSVLPSVKTRAGPAQIMVISPGGTWTATTTLVTLESEFAKPPMSPGKKGRIEIRVRGTDRRVSVLVTNEAPDVVRFLRGDTQEALSSGGADNLVQIEAQGIRSGDFAFRGNLMPPQDPISAQRYLEAAEPLASGEGQRQLKEIIKELARSHGDEDKLRRRLDGIIEKESGEGFRTLAASARALL